MSSSFIITTKSSTRLALIQLKKHRSDCLLTQGKACNGYHMVSRPQFIFANIIKAPFSANQQQNIMIY